MTMDRQETTLTPGSAFHSAVSARVNSIDSGNTTYNTRTVLEMFVEFLKGRGRESFAEVDEQDCRRFAQHLRGRVHEDEISASTAETYYATVRASLGWFVRDGRMDRNPAKDLKAEEELPEVRDDPDQQFWDSDSRADLLEYVERRAHEAVDEPGADRRAAFRDRALVSLLAFSGVRSAEIVRDRRDELRTGLRWERVDLDAGVATVLGKTRQWEDVALIDRVCTHLRRLKDVQDPPSESWPLFPTRHPPTVAGAVKDALRERGHSDEDITEEIGDRTYEEAAYDLDIPLPAITKTGLRNVMQDVCENAGISIDGEYLKPHGGRRGLGDEIYEESAELAQEVLRHRNIETTHGAYRDQQAQQRKSDMEDVLDE
jgi:integrase